MNNIRRNLIKDNIGTNLRKLFIDKDLTDVTLVSDDQVPFQAHKLVLSLCSHVLKDLLLENPQSHPIIFLRGIKHEEIQSILQFMYLGEAKSNRNRLDEFFLAVKKLQITKFSEELLKDESKESNNEAKVRIASKEKLLSRIDVPSLKCSVDENMLNLKFFACEECDSVENSFAELTDHREVKHRVHAASSSENLDESITRLIKATQDLFDSIDVPAANFNSHKEVEIDKGLKKLTKTETMVNE